MGYGHQMKFGGWKISYGLRMMPINFVLTPSINIAATAAILKSFLPSTTILLEVLAVSGNLIIQLALRMMPINFVLMIH